MNYKDLSVKRRQKNKANSKPIFVHRPEIRNKGIFQKCDLKKQSQFAPAQDGAKSYVKGDYDNKPAG